MAERLQGISAAHPLGTDTLGRDLLSRVLYGGRVSVLTAAAATALSMLLGLAVGLIAGYLGGWADGVITWFTSIFQGLPSTSVVAGALVEVMVIPRPKTRKTAVGKAMQRMGNAVDSALETVAEKMN